MKRGTTEHWFVVFSDSQPSLATASSTRGGAIEYWIAMAGENWRYWYRRGMRTKRVKIAWEVRT